jgi:hypothetical protein
MPAAIAFAGTVLGIAVNRRWLAVPLLVGGFLFQHALQGWCPPVPVLRRLGFRTAREIDIERVALKTVRGRFPDIRHGRLGCEKSCSACSVRCSAMEHRKSSHLEAWPRIFLFYSHFVGIVGSIVISRWSLDPGASAAATAFHACFPSAARLDSISPFSARRNRVLHSAL